MQLITNSDVNITCSNPEIMRDVNNEGSLHIQQNVNAQNQQSEDKPLKHEQCYQCVAQSIKKDEQISLDQTRLEEDRINEIVEVIEKIASNQTEKSSQNQFGNHREIDLNNLHTETEFDYTKFDRKPVEENLCESVTKVPLTATPNISQTTHHVAPHNTQSIQHHQVNAELSSEFDQDRIDLISKILTDFQQNDSKQIQTLEENVEKQIYQLDKQEEYSIVSNHQIKSSHFQTQSSKQINQNNSINDENEQIKYSQSIEHSLHEQIQKTLVEEQISESPKLQKSNQKLTKKSYDSQTDQISEAKSTNGSIKSRKSGVTDKRSIYSGCSSVNSAASLRSNKSNINYSNKGNAYNQRKNFKTLNKHDNEKTHFKKECLKPVIDIEPSERAKNRPKFKRTRMIIPPKQQINIPFESIAKRWSHIKEAEMRKLSILRKYSSAPDVNKHFDFTLWYELNKSYRKSFENQISSVDRNVTQTYLQRTLSESALNMLTCITTK